MAQFDTSLGGPNRSFPTTRWSFILAAADPGSPEGRERLSWLLAAYWKPVYAYIRAAWNKPVEDAKDLTQAFFAHILDNAFLSGARPGPGSFRTYLRRAVQNFMIDGRRSDAVRRAITPALSIDASSDELGRISSARPDDDPEGLFQREWFRCLMEGTSRELRDLLSQDGKAVYFEVFRTYYLSDRPVEDPEGDSAGSSYREIALRLGIKETDVRNYLALARREFEKLLRARIREYVSSDAEVEEELREVLKP